MRTTRTRWDGRGPSAQAAELRSPGAGFERITGEVERIIAEVREGGDAALRELTAKFDDVGGMPDQLRVSPAAIDEARDELPAELVESLELVIANVQAVAEAELESRRTEAELSQGQRIIVSEAPVDAAGVYAPGGRASYPSSVVMCCVPAHVAGVRRIAVVSPPDSDGEVSAAVLGACSLVGVGEVYSVGGAQAIAALALGTESIEAVDVVAGPGNRYVTEAKRQLFGTVGVDGLAGPTELAVVADRSADPDLVALDLLAQGEHGDESLLFLISPEADLLDQVGELVATGVAERPTVANASLFLVDAPDLDSAVALSDALAPEHLQLMVEENRRRLATGRVAGCVLVGSAAGTAFSDYAVGANHVLPTAGRARFGGPLGPHAFMRRTSIVELSQAGARRLAPHVEALARAEGLPVHGESALARASENGEG